MRYVYVVLPVVSLCHTIILIDYRRRPQFLNLFLLTFGKLLTLPYFLFFLIILYIRIQHPQLLISPDPKFQQLPNLLKPELHTIHIKLLIRIILLPKPLNHPLHMRTIIIILEIVLTIILEYTIL